MAPLSLAIIKRIWAYTAPYGRWKKTLLCLVVMRAAQLATLAWLLGWVINDTLAHRDPQRLIWGTAGYVALGIFMTVTLRYRLYFSMALGEAVVHDLRRDIFSKLQRLTMRFYVKTKLGRIISRVTSDAESVRQGVQEVLFVSMVGGGQMLVAAGFMIWIDWRLFMVVAAITPVMFLVNQVFRGRFSEAFRNQQESFSRVTATIAESVNGIRVTQGFGRQEENAKEFSGLVADHANYNLISARLRGFFMPLLDLNNQLFFAGLLLLGGWLVVEDGMAVGDIVQFFFLAGVFFRPVRILGNQYATALTAMAGAERVFHLLDQEPDWQEPADAHPIAALQGEVVFDDIHFSYDPGVPVLHGISFTARVGDCVALVGHTGSGKSSIINLISKFYLPDSGRLLIDGQDITQVEGRSLHKQMGIVLQSNFLFTGSVLDNIRMAKPEATEDEVRSAAETLGCLDLLEALPDGLATEVGEGGGSLSLGQRQLVCFTRAMLADPRILILDEATSAVDTITEARIQSALKILLAGRTSFVVAHRLSTIRHADQVLVLRDGLIIERGSHRELLEKGDHYADLYRQFLKGGE